MEKEEQDQIVIINNIQHPKSDIPDLRAITLYGDINETKASEVVASLLYLESTSHSLIQEDENDPDTMQEVMLPIEMYISTHGGSTTEMYSILDMMDMVKSRSCNISTIGLGKVMSAGVLILASGSPGARKVGRNCRLMLHGVSAGTVGTVVTMENELEEVKLVQDKYIDTLSRRTKLTKSKIKKILNSQKDIYISAQEAINYGIADEIL